MTDDLAFPTSLPEFQRLFPNDDACAAYLYGVRWRDGFVCPTCSARGEPYRFAGKPALLRCRACKRNTSVTADAILTWRGGAPKNRSDEARR